MQPLHVTVTGAVAAMPALHHNLPIAVGHPLPDDQNEEMGSDDFEGLRDVLLAGAAAAQKMQLDAQPMLTAIAAENQPNVEVALQVPAVAPGPPDIQLHVSCCCRAGRQICR